jgi:hypothetical protein
VTAATAAAAHAVVPWLVQSTHLQSTQQPRKELSATALFSGADFVPVDSCSGLCIHGDGSGHLLLYSRQVASNMYCYKHSWQLVISARQWN